MNTLRRPPRHSARATRDMTDQGGEPRPESPLQRMPSLAAWNGEEARAAPAAAADAPEREGGKLPGSAIEQHPRGAADRATGADASEGVRTADATTAVTAEPPSIAERATVAPSRERALRSPRARAGAARRG